MSDQPVAADEVVDDEVVIDENGDIVDEVEVEPQIADNAGEVDPLSEGAKKDPAEGSCVTTDPQGRVTSVTDAGGNSRLFEYNGDTNELVGIVETNDGDTKKYRKNEQGLWVDEEGNPTGAKDPKVDKDGNYSFTNPDGGKTNRKVDGSQVVTDKDGNVTSIYHKGDTKWQFKYDDNGNLVGASFDNGIPLHPDLQYKVAPDGQLVYANNGDPVGMRNLNVKADGSMSYVDDRGKTITHNSEGGRSESKHTLSFDDKGNVTKIDYGTGATQSFVHNDKGELVEMTDSSGNKWSYDGKQWSTTDKQGNKVTSDASVTVGRDGTYTITNRDGSVEKYNADSTSSRVNADGSGVQRNEYGQVVQRNTPDGRVTKIEYSSTGEDAAITSISGPGVSVSYQNGKYVDRNGVAWDSANVSADGSVILTVEDPKNGRTVVTHNTDGSRTIADRNGTATLNADGSSKLEAANGVKYSANPAGKLTEIEYGNSSWTAGANGEWIESVNGQPTGRKGYSPKIQADGSFSMNTEDGGTISRTADGATVTADKEGRVAQIDYNDGSSRKFGYDSAGEITSVQERDGSVWQKEGDQWIVYDPQGEIQLKVASGDVVVTKNGEMSVVYPPSPGYPNGRIETRTANSPKAIITPIPAAGSVD